MRAVTEATEDINSGRGPKADYTIAEYGDKGSVAIYVHRLSGDAVCTLKFSQAEALEFANAVLSTVVEGMLGE